MMPSFECNCGRRFIVPPGKYTCRTCGTIHEYRIDEIPVAKAISSPIISVLKRFAAESDRGIGDTVERLISKAGGKPLARFKAKLDALGVNCGCEDRQAWLNKHWPYRKA